MKQAFEKSAIDLFIISRVKELRNLHHLTQDDISIHLNISKGFIGQTESPYNRAKYNIQHLNELAKLFNCSPRDFLPESPL